MHQAILVHADINERAKSRHIADRAFKLHAFAQVLDIFDAVVKPRNLEIRPRVTPRLFQLGQDIFDGDHAKFFVGKQLRFQAFEHVGAAHELTYRLARLRHDLLDDRVGFRVNTGHIQRVAARAQPQKTGALLKGFSTQAGNFHQVSAAGKCAVRITPAHHRLCHRLAQARDAGQQRHAGSVQVHAYAVNAIFDHRVKAARQVRLVDVMLVLADANRFGIDLDKLGQRVLQAAGNTGGAAQAHVYIGHFLRCEFAG